MKEEALQQGVTYRITSHFQKGSLLFCLQLINVFNSAFQDI